MNTDGTSTRTSAASLALIRREHAGEEMFLARWNEAWRHYFFVGGHKRPDESSRECIVREVEEELGLRSGSGCMIADEPLACLKFDDWSERAEAPTAYTWMVFTVELSTSNVWETVESDAQNAWLTKQEIEELVARDGRPVSGRIAFVLSTIEGRTWLGR